MSGADWRCFHCDEVFNDEHSARDHFGRDETCEPACQIKMGAERSLLTALRRAENDAAAAWAAIHSESTDAAKAYHAQHARHQEQLRIAEELGYERGLRDAPVEAAAPSEEPVAFITEKLDGSRRSIMLASRYDPRKPDFWVNEAVRQEYRITPLFPATKGGEDELRAAFKAGWRTNAVSEQEQDAAYLDGCEGVDWQEYRARGLSKYLDSIKLDPSELGAAEEVFQARVKPWMMACFRAEISGDKVERGDRLLEEVLELLQSGGYDPARVDALRDYVWGRPAGEPAQEVGGVMITLAAYCLAFGLDMHTAGETELARIWTKVDKIRAKQAGKPTGSALPVASPAVAPLPLEVLLEERDKFIVGKGLWSEFVATIPLSATKGASAAELAPSYGAVVIK